MVPSGRFEFGPGVVRGVAALEIGEENFNGICATFPCRSKIDSREPELVLTGTACPAIPLRNAEIGCSRLAPVPLEEQEGLLGFRPRQGQVSWRYSRSRSRKSRRAELPLMGEQNSYVVDANSGLGLLFCQPEPPQVHNFNLYRELPHASFR